MIFSGPQDRAYLVSLLLDGSSCVLFELGLKVAAPHFDAQLSPLPSISAALLTSSSSREATIRSLPP